MTTKQALTELASRLERTHPWTTLDQYQTAGKLSFVCGPKYQDIRVHATDLLAAAGVFETARDGRPGVRAIAAVARHLTR